MSYGFKFYNSSGEIVLDDSYIKPWFAGKGTPTSVTGPVQGYNNDKYYTVNYTVPNIGGTVNFAAITLPNSGGEYWADTSWSVAYTFSINVYFANNYTPTSSDAPEVYFFSVNPVNPRSTSGYGLQLRNSGQECTFDSNYRHFKPSNAVAFTMPYRYATGYFSTSTGCGNPANQANCSQIITLSGVPTKAAFVLPYFFKSQAYTRYTANGNFSYLFDFQAVYRRSNTNEVTVRVATKNYEDMEGFFANYNLTQGGDNQYIIYIDGTQYDVGGGNINFPAATYSLSATTTTVAEGNNVVVTLTTTGVPDGTSVPWLIAGTNIAGDDFDFGGILTGSFTVQSNTASVTIPTTRNDNNEGTETATFSLTNNAASVAFNITNVPYFITPNITSFSYTPSNPDETGNSVVNFTINVQDNTISGAPRNFYWSIVGGANVTGDDFVGLIYGTLTTENGTGTRTFSITIKQDYVTENSTEQFLVRFYTDAPYGSNAFYDSSNITIADTSKDRPTINYFQIKPNSTGTYGTNVTSISGETPYFRWSVSNATSISIDNGVGTVNATGQDVALVGAVISATTYTLTATNQYGSVTSSVTFNVSASTYQLTTSATSINENGSVTITLTTTNVLNGTQVPYTINSSTFDASDWSGGALSSTGTFTVNNNTASRTFTSLADNRTDGNKTLTIALTNYPAVTVSTTILDTSTCPAANTFVSSQCIGYTQRNTYYTGNYSGGICTTYYTDSPNSVACGYVNYTITPNTTSITEGSSITYTVTTTNITNGTVLYWTNSGTTGTSQGTVTINSNSGTFTISTTAPNTYDGSRTVIANLRTGSYTGTIVATASTVSVTDAPTTWSLTQTATNITEGGSIGYTITTTNLVTPASPIYWEHIGTAGSADMSGTSGTINADGSGTYSLTISTTVDAAYNTTLKTVQIRFRNVNSSGTILATSQATTLSNAAPTYDISCYPASVNETTSALATFTVTCANVQDGTVLYWKNTGTINASDFTDNTNNGTVTINSNSATFTRTIARDQAYEGQETIVMELHSGSAMNSGTLLDSVTVPVSDTSQQADWEILGLYSIDEGTTSYYTVTGTPFVSTWGSTRVYLSIRHISSSSSDVSISNTNGIILSRDAGEATFAVTTVADATTEGGETFYLDLRKNSSSAAVETSFGPITINDTSATPVYTTVQIDSITWTPSSVNEGSIITFTVNATDNTTSGAPRNFYYALIGGGNNTGADYNNSISGTLTSQNGSFSRTFTIDVKADQLTEGSETFQIGIYKNGPYTGSPYYTTSNISINDTSLTPPYYGNVQINSITWTPSSVNEGSIITFTLNATDNTYSGAPRNFYYASIGGANTTGEDFSGVGYGTLTSENGTFTRTFTVTLAADQLTEGSESFSIGIYSAGPYSGSPYYQTAYITINDTSQTPNPPTIDYFQIKLSGGSYGSSVGPVAASGATPFFRWSTSGATTVNITNYGNTSASGNEAAIAGNVTTTTTWTLTASNAGGSVTSSVTMYVCSPDGTWDGSSYVCSGTNRYKLVSNGSCGTRTGDLWIANDYATCCTPSGTYLGNTRCVGSTLQRQYADGQCGSYWSDYQYNAFASCCTADGTWDGSSYVCVGSNKYRLVANGQCGTRQGTLWVSNDYATCCTPDGTWDGVSYSCYGTQNRYRVVANGQCGTRQGSLVTSNDYGYCCTPDGNWDGISYSCYGTTNRYRVVANGQCGTRQGPLVTTNDYSYCCPADGTWLGTYSCYGTQNKYQVVANGQCGTRQGPLAVANDYATCCTASGTWTGATQCSGSTLQRQYHNGQCGYYWADYQYNAYSTCCTASGTWTGNTRCSGTTLQREYANGQCGTYWGDYQYNAYSSCCPADGTFLYYSCYDTPHKYQVVANGQCGERQGGIVEYNAYSYCCAPAGYSGATQCTYYGGGAGYGIVDNWYNNGQCGGYWVAAEPNQYCCLPYGTYLYGYCASSNVGNNNKINVYSGGGHPTGCGNYTSTEYNSSECYVSPPAVTIDCSATSPASPRVGTTIYWNVNGSCSGNSVFVYASNGSSTYLPCSGTISGVGANLGLSGYHFLQFSYGGATCYAWVNFMEDSDGGGA